MTGKDPEKHLSHEEQKIIVYEIDCYCCEHYPVGGCNELMPGKEKIVSVIFNRSTAQTFSDAFVKAKETAPLCPFHEIPMIPQLLEK